MRQDIAIFNNTQNPITSRDMVANRPEQKHLNEWLMDETIPQIYVEIRRGSQIPSSFNKNITHRKTTNEELAQLVYASFLQKPFTAKDKKSALFNNDYTQSDYVINKIYHDVFNWDENDPSKNGVIFTKSKRELEEALFIQQLYKESKREMRDIYNKRLQNAINDKEKAVTPEQVKSAEDRIATYSLRLDIVGICMFYFVALYYEYKIQFSHNPSEIFDFERYYTDKEFRQQLISSCTSLFLAHTVKILVLTATANGKQANVNNWVRSAACEPAFFDALRADIASNLELEDKYKQFCKDYMNWKGK